MRPVGVVGCRGAAHPAPARSDSDAVRRRARGGSPVAVSVVRSFERGVSSENGKMSIAGVDGSDHPRDDSDYSLLTEECVAK